MSSESNTAYLKAYEANIPPLYTIRKSKKWIPNPFQLTFAPSRVIDMGTS